MQASELGAGRAYVWSLTPKSAADEMRRVKYLGTHRGGKAKVRWLDGDLTGLDEWTPTRHLVCQWKDRAAFLRDRERQLALDALAAKELDRVVEDAISTVFVATGEEGGFSKWWPVEPAQAARMWVRAGLPGDPLAEPGAFVDRFGMLHLSCRSALRFAQAFATASPTSFSRSSKTVRTLYTLKASPSAGVLPTRSSANGGPRMRWFVSGRVRRR